MNAAVQRAPFAEKLSNYEKNYVIQTFLIDTEIELHNLYRGMSNQDRNMVSQSIRNIKSVLIYIGKDNILHLLQKIENNSVSAIFDLATYRQLKEEWNNLLIRIKCKISSLDS